MSYEKIGFTDGTTPLDMENFNHMEDGIAANADALDDKADKEDLDKLSEDVDELNADLTDKLGGISISAAPPNNTISGNGGTFTFSGQLALLVCAYSAGSATNGTSITMFRNGYAMPLLEDDRIEVLADGTTYTIVNNNTTALRYFLFVHE